MLDVQHHMRVVDKLCIHRWRRSDRVRLPVGRRIREAKCVGRARVDRPYKVDVARIVRRAVGPAIDIAEELHVRK